MIHKVIDAIDFAVYQFDINHIILDNLQFMMPRTEGRSDFAKFDNQDLVIEKLRKYCTEKQVSSLHKYCYLCDI